jgi:hypothetical protein
MLCGGGALRPPPPGPWASLAPYSDQRNQLPPPCTPFHWQAAVAAVLHSLAARMRAVGVLSVGDGVGELAVRLPCDGVSPPTLDLGPDWGLASDHVAGGPARSSGSGAPGKSESPGAGKASTRSEQQAGEAGNGGGATGLAYQRYTGLDLVVELLDQLKRSYWSWDWPLVGRRASCQL